ncbi:MAG TPA: hypothetical protein VHQ91_10415 [Geminicoccaceae bacterium]|nr:hypothetical protein [Geminicoccaceae bacterium]
MHALPLDHGALPRPLAWIGRVGGRQLGRRPGWLLVGLSFWFVGARLWQAAPWGLVRTRLELLLPVMAGGALAYGLAGFLLAAAWRQILAGGRPPGPAAGYHAIYGRSQIAKYLAGNCFHFVGRQVLGRALGHSQAALALASLIETALLVALATALALPLAQAQIGAWALALPAGALLFLSLALAAPGLLGSRSWPAAAGRSRGLVRAAMLQGAFFAVAGGVLWALAAARRPRVAGARTVDQRLDAGARLGRGLRRAGRLGRHRRPRGGPDPRAQRRARRRSERRGRADAPSGHDGWRCRLVRPRAGTAAAALGAAKSRARSISINCT